MKNSILTLIVVAICAAPLSAMSEVYRCGDDTVIQIDKNPPRVAFRQFGGFPEATVTDGPVMSGNTMKWKMALKGSPSCVFEVKAVYVSDMPQMIMNKPIDLQWVISGSKCADYGTSDSSMMCPAE